MLEILERICRGEGQPGDVELLQDLGKQIQAGSLCGLGASAPNPALSTIRYFAEEYRAHIEEHKCPSHSCRPLLEYHIKPENARVVRFARANARLARSAASCGKFL